MWQRYGKRYPDAHDCHATGWRSLSEDALAAAEDEIDLLNDLEVIAEREALDELAAIERDAARAAMGEDEDSLMLGGCGGVNDAEDPDWY